jgi:predicted neutral ceramidase superfamily lipid hydrolase
MRAAFKYLTSLLFLAIVVQVGVAAVGAFNAIDRAGKDQQITKKQIESGFDPHGLFGTLVLLLILIVVIMAFVAKVDPLMKRIASGLVVLGALQVFFAWLGTKSAPAGFLHGINALAIYGAAAVLAHRAWTQQTVEAAASV